MSTTEAAPPSTLLVQKSIYVVALISAIWLVGDRSFNVFSALKLHEPSFRIFRSLLEINLLIGCAAVSLSLWTRCIGQDVVERLFFHPLLGEHDIYQQVNSTEDDDLLQQDMDADYDEDGEVPPPKPKVTVVTATELTHIALDMFLAILVALFLFTLSSSRDTRDEDINNDSDRFSFWKLYSRIAAPTFPLLVFFYCFYRAFAPWDDGRRRPFWTVVVYTLGAPWYQVSFRDGFIGDVLTSSVRPLKDISFTIFYILFGLKGWWATKEYREMNFLELADVNIPFIERSWIVHTVVLPICAASPLWWRFLQNLRQVYDERKRWPFLGNALKYFIAAQVAMFGVFHPEKTHNVWFLASFVIATLYQCWWDVYMDWELLDKNGHLRSRRLYKSKSFYWAIAWTNLILRFFWTLGFLPLHYLNAKGVLTANVSRDMSHILAPTIASAEIIRRTIWGFLRFEWEAIKKKSMVDDDKTYSDDKNGKNQGSSDNFELCPMSVQESGEAHIGGAKILSPVALLLFGDMSSMNPVQVIGELVAYATGFCLFCFVVAAHRGTY